MIDAEDRPTAAEALELPFLQEHHDPATEPVYPLGEIDASFEDHHGKDEWRQLIFDEIANFRLEFAPLSQPEPKSQ